MVTDGHTNDDDYIFYPQSEKQEDLGGLSVNVLSPNRAKMTVGLHVKCNGTPEKVVLVLYV